MCVNRNRTCLQVLQVMHIEISVTVQLRLTLLFVCLANP